jgi:hypothetical protein
VVSIRIARDVNFLYRAAMLALLACSQLFVLLAAILSRRISPLKALLVVPKGRRIFTC